MAYAGKSGGRRPSIKPKGSIKPRTGTLTVGLAIGLLVGAGIALLVAQQTGSETRRALRRGFKRAGRRGRDAWDDLRYELRQARRALLHARRRNQPDVEELVETIAAP